MTKMGRKTYMYIFGQTEMVSYVYGQQPVSVYSDLLNKFFPWKKWFEAWKSGLKHG